MSPTTTRVILSCLIIGAVVCLCLGAIGAVAGGILFLRPESPVVLVTPEEVEITRPPRTTPRPQEPTEAAPGLEATPQEDEPTAQATPQAGDPGSEPTAAPPEAGLPPEIAREMDEIQEQVIALRNLEPQGTVDRTLLTPEELNQRVQEDFLQDYTAEEARIDSIVLAAFGLLEPDFDFRSFYIDLLSEQVAGFYDDEDKAMYVVQGEGFQGPERLTYSHEYVHALQDQNYDFEDGLNYNDESCDEDSERCAAIQALIEGDATVAEFEWFSKHADAEDVTEIQEFYSNYQSPVYDQAPAFMKEDFVFPYRAGQAFVEHLKEDGGWAAVDAAYGNLPVSTEQILHPERYPDDQPVPVTLPDLASLLGDGWSELDRGVMGEWYTYLILTQGLDEGSRLGEGTANQAAEGWGGDSYVVYYNEATQETVMVLSMIWDSINDAREFSTAFRRYATARFGDPSTSQNSFYAWDTAEGTHTFRLDTDRTIWILAQDAEQAESIWQAIQAE